MTAQDASQPPEIAESLDARLDQAIVFLKSVYQEKSRALNRDAEVVKARLAEISLRASQTRTIAQQSLAAVSLAGAVAFNNPTVPLQTVPTTDLSMSNTIDQQVWAGAQVGASSQEQELLAAITLEERQAILEKLAEVVRRPPGHMERQEELYLEQQLTDMLGFEVAAELEGNRLNHSLGIMGGEQHLRRFPDDTLDQHDNYREAGIASNRGAFGWFTEGGELTERAIQREKYYVAVQTMYLPNWNTDHPRLKEWYAFRKMVVINPTDKRAVVAVVADAGPAQWVKKQFGGSPEVIREGNIWSRENRGRVLLLFVNDPDDTIPLGPIDLNLSPLDQQVAALRG